MKFAAVLALAASTVMAAPSLQARQDDSGADPSNASGTILCTPESKVCKVECGTGGAQALCDVVAVVDSVGYGVETLAGFTITCTEDGCDIYCPKDDTAVCVANALVSTVDTVVAKAENAIILKGAGSLLDSLGGLTDSAKLPGLPGM